mgnify:CR=1 FL=1
MTTEILHAKLKENFGFEKFRPNQEAIINCVLSGQDTLAIMPTGGGKSICFQVPGIIREGITIVISPLIALMQDQVSNLQSKGIMAKAIMSGMSYRELDVEANRLARYLIKQGVRQDVVVGLCMTRSLELVIAQLAVLKAGGGYAPLDPSLPVARLSALISGIAPEAATLW